MIWEFVLNSYVLSSLIGVAEAATWPAHIDRAALDGAEEQRHNYHRYLRVDYEDDTSGLSVRHGYIYRAASAPEGLFDYQQGWGIMRTAFSSLQRHIITDATGAASNPYLRDLSAGEYILVTTERGITYRFRLDNDEWKGVDGWNTDTLTFQSYASGSGRWEWQGQGGAVSTFNEQGLLQEYAADNRYYTYSYNTAGLYGSTHEHKTKTLLLIEKTSPNQAWWLSANPLTG